MAEDWESTSRDLFASYQKFISAFGEEHGLVAMSLNSYGDSLRSLKRYDEAERALRESHEMVLRVFGPDHSNAVRSTERFVTLYEEWDKAELADRWRKQLPRTEPSQARK